MSPVGGVGINLAIQGTVTAANILARNFCPWILIRCGVDSRVNGLGVICLAGGARRARSTGIAGGARRTRRTGIAGGARRTRRTGIAGRTRLAVYRRVVVICSDDGDFVRRFDWEHQLYRYVAPLFAGGCCDRTRLATTLL